MMPKRLRLKREGSKARKGRMKVVDFSHMDYSNLFDFVNDFFLKRFGRSHKYDKMYFQEWMERYRTGNPEVYMDNRSLSVHRELLKKKGWITAHSR